MKIRPSTIKNFLLKWILLFSGLGFLLIFIIASQAYTSSIRDNANTVAERVAQQTFSSMYLVMSQGWNRTQLEKFLAQMAKDNSQSDLKVVLYRGPVVDELFGPIDQPALGPQVVQAMATGMRGLSSAA